MALPSVFQLQPLTGSISAHTLPAPCLPDAPGTIEIPVLRHGSDLSSLTSVWCATRPSDPPSASPGVDYIPSSKKVEFKPGKTEEVRAGKWRQTFVTRGCRFSSDVLCKEAQEAE